MNRVLSMAEVQLGRACPSSDAPSDDSLRTGIINEGCASGPTGSSAWYDASFGASYGEGRRYAHEETYGITLVPSRHK